MNLIDNALGIHAKALGLRSKRMEVLARNIANADTPHYKAKDIDFKKNSCINKHMMLMHKHLFGENIITTEIIGKYKVGTKRSNLYKYTINLDITDYQDVFINFANEDQFKYFGIHFEF